MSGNRWLGIASLCVLVVACSSERSTKSSEAAVQHQGVSTSFASGSLIIPVDETYATNVFTGAALSKNTPDGTLKAFGLVDKLLRAGEPVSWVVDSTKTQVGASGTADITVTTTDEQTCSLVTNAGFKAGPFVVDASNASAATT